MRASMFQGSQWRDCDAAGERGSERGFNPDITEVKVIVDWIPNKVNSQGMEGICGKRSSEDLVSKQRDKCNRLLRWNPNSTPRWRDMRILRDYNICILLRPHEWDIVNYYSPVNNSSFLEIEVVSKMCKKCFFKSKLIDLKSRLNFMSCLKDQGCFQSPSESPNIRKIFQFNVWSAKYEFLSLSFIF